MRSKLQFSLLSLVAVSFVVAVACTALVNANVWWSSGIFTVTLAMIGWYLLSSIFFRQEAQAFAIGFVVCSCLHLLLISWPSINTYQVYPQPTIASGLITTQVSQFAYTHILPTVREQPAYLAPTPYGPTSAYQPPTATYVAPAAYGQPLPFASVPPAFYPAYLDFMRICNGLWTVVIGFIGAFAARLLYASRQRAIGTHAQSD